MSSLAERRAANLAKIIDGYDVHDDPDSSVPGAARVRKVNGGPSALGCDVVTDHPRLALVTQYGDKGNYRVHLAEDRRGVEQLAAYVATDADGGEAIVCYFDLDELAGEEPTFEVGDWVCVVADSDGEAYEITSISSPDATHPALYHLEGAMANDYAAEQLVDSDGDERMPVRYSLAKVVVSVVFNTVPSP
jgi:hypothetical protein